MNKTRILSSDAGNARPTVHRFAEATTFPRDEIPGYEDCENPS